MNELFGGWPFALRRLRAHWRLVFVAAIGVVVAATLLAVAPIYAGSMSDLGLRFRLDRGLASPDEQVAWIAAGGLALGSPADAQRRVVMDAVTEARIGWLGTGMYAEDRTSRMDLSFPDFEPPEGWPVPVAADVAEPVRQPWGTFLFALDPFEEGLELVAGRMPGPAAGVVEVVVPDGFQRHAAIGDRVEVTGPRYDDCVRVPASEDPNDAANEVRCRPSAFVSTSAVATIVGFVRPRDPDARRWELFQADWTAPEEPFVPRLPADPDPEDPLMARALAGEGSMPLITTTDQLFGAMGRLLPEQRSRHRVGIVVDRDGIPLAEVGRAIDDIFAWRAGVGDGIGGPAPSRVPLLRELERFRNQQSFSQVPLLIILLQVVGIVVYYVVVVMTMLLDRQAEEIGVYRSRGASTGQLVGFTVIEGFILAVPAALAGPWLAGRLVAVLGYTPTFEAITGGGALPAQVPPVAFVLAAGGAALALVAMVLPALVAVRRGIVDVKREQSRPGARGVIQRYYIDVAMVGLAALLLWQLRQRGTVFDPDSVGGWSADPLLLASPMVFTLAVAAAVLRFYPPLLRATVRVLLVFRGTAVAIGLRRAGRSPAAYARLLLLLVMAIAVGTFAASYGPTVGRSLTERNQYTVGVDLRGMLRDSEDEAVEARLAGVRATEGVRDAAAVHRGTVTTPARRGIPLLAIDVERAPQMLWFREDFAEPSLAGLIRQITSAVPAGGGLLLPDDAEQIEVRVHQEGQAGRQFIVARFRDGDGHFRSTPLETSERTGWTTVRGRIQPTYARPLTFVGFQVSDRLGQNLRTDGAMHFDDIAAVTTSGLRVVLEDFEREFRWSIFREPDLDERLEVTDEIAASGQRSARWEWASAISPRVRVLAPSDPAVPLAAIGNEVSRALLGAGEDGVGSLLIGDVVVPVVVRVDADYFPTLDPAGGFLVINLEHLRSVAGTIDATALQFPNELWVDFDDRLDLAGQAAVIERLMQPIDSPLRIELGAFHLQSILEEVEADPTLQASGTGVLVLAFVAVLGLSTLGFVVTLVLGARARTVEFAVLRAIGSSGRQVLRALFLEWGIVLVIGAVIGVLLGRRVATVMLSFLDVTEEGARVLPPFTLETDWVTLGVGLAILGAVVVAGLAMTWAVSMRRAASSTLRITQ